MFPFCLIFLLLSTYLSACVSLSHLFYILAGASAERQPVEIPFSLISGDRAQGTPGEPGQLAGLWAVAGACLAPGPGLTLSRHVITPERCIYIAVHFHVCHKCQRLASPEQITAPVPATGQRHSLYTIRDPLENAFMYSEQDSEQCLAL